MGKLLLWAGIGYVAWLVLSKPKVAAMPVVIPNVKPLQPIPDTAVITGRTERTFNGGKPGEEVVGFMVRDWAEIRYPNGVNDWISVQKL